MANTIQDVLDDIRLELTDELESRWTDAQLIRLIGKAYRRLNHLLYRNDIEFGRYVTTINVTSGQTEYYLPNDFMVDYGLYRDATHAKLTKESDDSWELLDGSGELTSYIIRGDTLTVAGTPTASETLTLVYWPQVNTSDMAAGDPSPYSGKLDDLVSEYAALRAKNIDEMNATFDAQLLQDLENNVLNTFSAISPTTVQRRGWLV